ncbi:MAG: LysR family transcriptional regulator [Oscillospiraceae bacterium]|nr:LysR family transcriptional regulator [Oscillospiraceae bacterium]
MVDNRLYSLLKVVELGSFTKAAEQLSLSQPAVSQHIRQLEDSLNVKIFEHAHNKFHLTAEGEIVVKYARQMIALDKNLERALINEKGRTRSLTIGITHTAESSAIIEALVACTNRYEGLNLRILTNTADQLYTMLKNYELDFAFIEGRSGDPGLGYLMLDTDCLVLAVAPDHPLAQQSMVTITQLRKEKLILRLPESNTRDLFEATLRSQNLAIEDFNITLEIDSVASIKDLVRRGFGVSVLAKSACLDEQRKKKLCLLTIENLSMVRETNIVYRKSFEHPELLQGIVEMYNEMNHR